MKGKDLNNFGFYKKKVLSFIYNIQLTPDAGETFVCKSLRTVGTFRLSSITIDLFGIVVAILDCMQKSWQPNCRGENLQESMQNICRKI